MDRMASDPRNIGGGADTKLGETGPNMGGCLNMQFTRARKKLYCAALIEAVLDASAPC